MTEEDIKIFALSLGGAKCDYPFEDDFKTFVMRHSASKKWFGIYISAPVKSLLRDERGEKREAIARFSSFVLNASPNFRSFCRGISTAWFPRII